jgi:hypothetical protein
MDSRRVSRDREPRLSLGIAEEVPPGDVVVMPQLAAAQA